MKKKLMAFLLTLVFVLSFNSPKLTVNTDAAGYEHAWFPVNAMNITQIAYESYSHDYSNHIDCVGSNGAEDWAFAPFTGKIVNYSYSYGVVLFQSIDQVYYPDGSLGYMTVQFMHGSNYTDWVSKYNNGEIIPQGTAFYKIGGTDKYGNVNGYGKHYDIGVYKGQKSTFNSTFSSFGNTYAFDAFYINPSKTPSIINKGVVESGNTVNYGAPTNWTNLWRNLPSGTTVDVTYQTYDDVKKVWLTNVTNASDYAGIFGHDVDCVYASLSSGNITYKVHVKGGSWLSAVTNRTDYAGIKDRPIDGFMATTDTGKTIHYRVHLRTTGQWLPYVTGYNQYDNNNGYAGTLGQEIDAIQMYLE